MGAMAVGRRDQMVFAVGNGKQAAPVGHCEERFKGCPVVCPEEPYGCLDVQPFACRDGMPFAIECVE